MELQGINGLSRVKRVRSRHQQPVRTSVLLSRFQGAPPSAPLQQPAETKPRSIADLMKDLRDRLAEIKNLSVASALINFDRETRLPEKAKAGRSRVLGTLSKLSHAKMTSPETGRLIQDLNRPEALSTLSDVDQALVKLAAKRHEEAAKLPADLAAEVSKATSEARVAWGNAYDKGDYSLFEPHLEKMVELAKKQAELTRKPEHATLYDVMLDEYEEGASTETLDKLFGELRQELVPLVKAIGESQAKVDDSFRRMPEGTYPEADQKAFGEEVAADLGFDFKAGYLDKVRHPFATGIDSPFDVRVNTRYKTTDPMESFIATVHEVGHGLYDQGIHPRLYGTLLANGASLGIHESQSRFWEKNVAQSKPFWEKYLPRLKEKFPAPLKDVTLEQFYKGVNKVKPSLVRIDADEVTYSLHVMVRYEMEKALFNGGLSVKDAPAEWNKKMQEYLGVTPPDHKQGILQDVHWSMGAFGYFPTYTLGSILAAQLYHKLEQELAEKHSDPEALEKRIRAGQFGEIREWLREKIHEPGKMAKPEELILKATGEPLTAKYYLDYLWKKYSEIYPDIQGKRPQAS